MAKNDLTRKEALIFDSFKDISDEELNANIAEGHNYKFIGRVGQFCPIKPGFGGGLLMREKDGKYYAATGSKGFRWMESEVVKTVGKEKDIDRSYYDNLVNGAIDTISQYGDFEWFVSDDLIHEEKDIPPWSLPCGDDKRESCHGCPNLYKDKFHTECNLGYDISNIIFKGDK